MILVLVILVILLVILGLPIFAEDDYLNYEGLLVYSSDTFGIEFNVNVSDTLNVPMWVADMFLTPESVIGITHRSGSEGIKTYVYTDLSGGIDITGDLTMIRSLGRYVLSSGWFLTFILTTEQFNYST